MPNPETLGHNELNCEELGVSFIGRLGAGVTIVARDADALKRVRVDAVTRCRANCRYGRSFSRSGCEAPWRQRRCALWT